MLKALEIIESIINTSKTIRSNLESYCTDTNEITNSNVTYNCLNKVFWIVAQRIGNSTSDIRKC